MIHPKQRLHTCEDVRASSPKKCDDYSIRPGPAFTSLSCCSSMGDTYSSNDAVDISDKTDSLLSSIDGPPIALADLEIICWNILFRLTSVLTGATGCTVPLVTICRSLSLPSLSTRCTCVDDWPPPIRTSVYATARQRRPGLLLARSSRDTWDFRDITLKLAASLRPSPCIESPLASTSSLSCLNCFFCCDGCAMVTVPVAGRRVQVTIRRCAVCAK